MNLDEHSLVLVLALLLDRIIGDPQWLWMRVPHPVAIFGRAIGYFDQHFNRESLSKAQRRSERRGGDPARCRGSPSSPAWCCTGS